MVQCPLLILMIHVWESIACPGLLKVVHVLYIKRCLARHDLLFNEKDGFTNENMGGKSLHPSINFC